MRFTQYTIRLPLEQCKLIRQLAASRDISAYGLLQQSVRVGLVELSGQNNSAQAVADMVREIGTISARLVHLERLSERLLFTSIAAYSYARAGAGGRLDDVKLTNEINEAFRRQLQLVGEGL
jgi:hypothetical protein